MQSCELTNRRKPGPDFPKLFRKERTQGMSTSFTFITSLLSLGTENGTIPNPLQSPIAAKDTELPIVRKKTIHKEKKVFPTLLSIVCINGVLKSLLPLSTPNVRRTDASVQKLYGIF